MKGSKRDNILCAPKVSQFYSVAEVSMKQYYLYQEQLRSYIISGGPHSLRENKKKSRNLHISEDNSLDSIEVPNKWEV